MNPNDPTGQNPATTPPSGETNPDVPEGEQPGKRSAEARIDQLIAQTKQQSDEIAQLKQRMTPMPPTDQPDPKVQEAVSQLKKLGFTTKDELAGMKQTIQDEWLLNAEHQRLAESYSGSDGRPKYDSTTVEEYMRKNGIYSPEIAYKALHESELLDWHLKQAGTPGATNQPYTTPAAPSGNRDSNVITRELIQEKMKSPDWRQWYEENREKILSLAQQGALQ